jgi:hypothetical protein
VSNRGRLVILTLGLLALVTVFGVLSLTPFQQAVSAVHLLYTNGTILNKDCTFGNEGPIVAPHKVSNDCSVRVWLYTNAHRTGRTLCLDPKTTTGTLHTAWVYFWVSKNPNVCSSSNVGTVSIVVLCQAAIPLEASQPRGRSPTWLAGRAFVPVLS